MFSVSVSCALIVGSAIIEFHNNAYMVLSLRVLGDLEKNVRKAKYSFASALLEIHLRQKLPSYWNCCVESSSRA